MYKGSAQVGQRVVAFLCVTTVVRCTTATVNMPDERNLRTRRQWKSIDESVLEAKEAAVVVDVFCFAR